MTLSEAMKRFLCAILDDGTTPDDITASNATEIWVLIADAFNERFNGGVGAVAPLTVEFGEGAASGTTRAYLTGGVSGESYVYKVGVESLPPGGSDLTTWTTWDGATDIPADEGQVICIAQIDSSGIVTRAGIVVAVVAI